MQVDNIIYYNTYNPFSKRFTRFRLLILVSLELAVIAASSSCVQRSKQQILTNLSSPAIDAININAAGAQELSKLPGIGDELARRIIDYREKNGAFRRPEHLLLVRGISEAKFREMRDLIKTE